MELLLGKYRFTKELGIALLAVIGIFLHVVLRFTDLGQLLNPNIPLYVVLIGGGIPLVWELFLKALRGEFGSDLLAGISIVVSVLLGEYLAGTLVVLMLSGGEALEEYAVDRASSVLKALAKRMPSVAHLQSNGGLKEIPLNEIKIGDLLIVLPHEICPVDGEVTEGRSVMDESYLTGEPFEIAKTPGSDVMSGAINGEGALTIRATKLAVDSRYARIMDVMRKAEAERPPMRRLADQLGAFYTPLALAIAGVAWLVSGDPRRFLAVLVIATPCPLLIAIPISIIGSISLAARRGIIIRSPSILERISKCRTVILDKTGTLTYGHPKVTDVVCADGFKVRQVLGLAASLEQYSKHPLADSVQERAGTEGAPMHAVTEISERPGQGLKGTIEGHEVRITSRKQAAEIGASGLETMPEHTSGMECVLLLDKKFAALLRFHDAPRSESLSFVRHLSAKHKFDRVMIVSGDRESEVRYLAEQVGITEVYSGQSPEQKVERVKEESRKARTLFIGDGINDAPALSSAYAGIAFGQHSDITSEAAGAVILDTSLEKVDELFHIAAHMRKIALQSAVGGMALSIIGMLIASFGILSPVMGAIGQELIDLIAVLNSLRAGMRPRTLTDFE